MTTVCQYRNSSQNRKHLAKFELFYLNSYLKKRANSYTTLLTSTSTTSEVFKKFKEPESE